ncbi:group 1 glycosyl transferase [Petrotoga miotherma DSM 10691]|uniref:Group 1 glycosyl transferase n=1 Tax=Petrotoga miotherma DSM 10691 TaxID=1434326 RepID=A0A2K1PCN8_9BACT|nr:glycosyltransferase [Petrotoga miotherma]PNS00549.1 group 1 glycosyl transferase [Petrotoga miotherma DSM 10691]
MKVLFITNLLPFSHNPARGIFITNRLKTMQSFNINFVVYGITSKDSFGIKLLKKILSIPSVNSTDSFYEVDGVKYKYAFFSRSLGDVFNSRVLKKNNQIKDSKEVAEDLFNKIKDDEFDIIHAHGMYDAPAGLVAKVLSEKLNIPYVVTCHGSDINLAMPKAKELYVDILENAARVIFVSNALLNKAKSFGYAGENSVVIPNGIEPDIFKPLDKEKIKEELGLSKKVVGFVGGLKKVKRADKLPDIFSYISSIYDTEFLVVGNGELKENIENECKKRRLKVNFVGSVSHEEVPYYMNAMDVMILPSRNEGFGAVVIEAQGCGVAVVGSGNGGIPEAIGDGGVVVKEGEEFEKRFAESVVKLLENPIDGSYLRNRALGFSWESIVEKEIEVYNEALNRFGGSNA